MANALEILIKARDAASPVLKGVASSVQGVEHATDSAARSSVSFGGVASSALKGIGIAAGAAAAVVGLVTAAITKMAFDAAPLQGIQAAYEGITGGGEEMLAQLRKQSSYMIADRDLMKSYNQAAQLVGKTFADQLPSAMKYLTKVSSATGQSMDYMMDSLVRGVGRLSPLILDNLGVQVSLEEATARAAAMFKKEADELSKAEIQAGMMNVTMQKLAENTADMPDVTGTASRGLAAISAEFQNMRDQIGTAALPALQAVLDLSDGMRPFFENAITWVSDLVRGWAEGFAGLVAQAANWGANIMESLASGIAGSDAIVRALRGVANTIQAWLMPGSPPKLLPDLPEWGAGALDAWLSGWSDKATVASSFLQGLKANLKPFLEQIDLGKGINASALTDVFGKDAPDVRRYLRAYEAVGVAVKAVETAREDLTEAEESGDEDAITVAKKRLGEAEKEEYSARRTFNAEERRMETRISAEAQLTKAIIETARVQTKAATDAAQMAEEAKQRLIAQAFLQYRLAVAGTPMGQIAIWEEELAKAEEGSAEFWQIQTRLVELRRAAAKGEGEAVGASLWDGMETGLTEGAEDAEPAITEAIDWGGIGTAIGGAIVNGIVTGFESLSIRLKEWAQGGAGTTALFEAGGSLADLVIAGIRGIFGLETEQSDTTASIESHLQNAAFNAGAAVIDIGSKLAEGIIASFAAALTGGGTKEETMAAWEASVADWRAPIAGLATRLFNDPVDAAIVAQALLDVANNEAVATGVREAARVQAQQYMDEYDLKVSADLVVMTADAFRALAIEQGIIGAAEASGAAVGAAMGDAASQAMEDAFSANPPVLQYGPELPAGYYPQPPPPGPSARSGYAEGGIVRSPTLTWVGEDGPELIIPLSRIMSGLPSGPQMSAEEQPGGPVYNITIPIDARGANAKEVEIGVLRGLRGAGIPIGY